MLERQSNFKAWLYLAPALILLGLFTFYPLFNAFRLSVLRNYIVGDFDRVLLLGFLKLPKFTFENFSNVVNDINFKQAVKNTTIIVFVSVPISVIVALLISVLLNSIKKLQGIFQTIFFLPYVTNAIAIGMAFAFIFNTQYGLLNTMIGWFIPGETIADINWLGSWELGMVSLLIYTVWGGLAFKIMVFLSGLQSIDKQYYDAARVDATPKGRVFSKITVPLLSPMIAYITITSFIGAFKAYRTIVGLFGPDVLPDGTLPDQSFITIVGLIYKSLEKSLTPGMVSEAAAASILLFFTTLIFTLINMWVSKKRVHY